MIIGIGNDLIDIRRIEQSLARFGVRFEKRLFTPAEQETARLRAKAGPRAFASTYAKRFAAKEACSKALGTGLRQSSISWQELEVSNLASGAPTLTLSGSALVALNSLLPAGNSAHIHLSMTDEYPYALAQVVIEALPAAS